MASFFQKKTKLTLILSLLLLIGVSIFINKFNVIPKDEDSAFSFNGSGDGGLYKPPIDAPDEAGRLIQQASENYFFHEFAKGAENYRKAIAIYESENKIPQAARTYESLGDLYKFAHDVREAETSYLKAVTYHTKSQDAVGEGRALQHVGDLYMDLGELERAGGWYQKAGLAVRGAKPHRDLAKVHEAIGQYYWKKESMDLAIGSFKQAQDTFAALKDQMGYDHVTNVITLLRKKVRAGSDGQAGGLPPVNL